MKIEFDTFFKPRRSEKNPFPSGMVIFVGPQGSGKSLCATHYIKKLKEKYPNLYVYSNIYLTIADKIIDSSDVANHILEDQAGRPIVFFIDEIQNVLYNKKSSINFETFQAICQQRKAKKTIISTAQQFLDLDIRYRRQLLAQVECIGKKYSKFQIELWKDPNTLQYDPTKLNYVGKTFDVHLWKRHNDAFDIYNSYEIVRATMDLDKTAQLQARQKIQLSVGGLSPD